MHTWASISTSHLDTDDTEVCCGSGYGFGHGHGRGRGCGCGYGLVTTSRLSERLFDNGRSLRAERGYHKCQWRPFRRRPLWQQPIPDLFRATNLGTVINCEHKGAVAGSPFQLSRSGVSPTIERSLAIG
ncbi:hypothetical protein K469DRAFT_299732 [Zopfia rhizophila CBS 207.26]|uniref:Uncharacterized protein n=1 Tax=Zopfia rhizophila CBS 207.26 TaxID=1314779 RepID=A0A6A6DMQ7_9PEZI|nr:hypothetical protein K469DRAFT_299732 [Zopfia rhizophila CBS 207.26]